jgi:membrane protein DedA with SNARE-associated domain
MRFLYGIRPLLPAVLGLSTIPCWRFALLNLLGALLWAGVFALLGYLAGDAASLLLTELRCLERWVLVAVVSFSLILALVRWHRLWWRRRRGPRPGTDSMPRGQS